ncbi:9130_t:CDS:2, partial [Funneliformis mosseae]
KHWSVRVCGNRIKHGAKNQDPPSSSMNIMVGKIPVPAFEDTLEKYLKSVGYLVNLRNTQRPSCYNRISKPAMIGKELRQLLLNFNNPNMINW